jgi:hypothetical protein
MRLRRPELRNSLEQKRATFTRQSFAPQLAVKRAEVDRLNGSVPE